MTCSGCAATVKRLLAGVDGVTRVGIDLVKGEAEVEMPGHVGTGVLRMALKEHPKYGIAELPAGMRLAEIAAPAGKRMTEVAAPVSWLATYKPILLLFGYITMVAAVAAGRDFDVMLGMRVFMSGFFLSFSFFKLLDLRAFAESYAMYDIIARRWGGWGYLYVFIELGLGLAFAMNYFPVYTNWVTLVVMTVSIVGVLQAVFNKRKIRCACLGAVFNLPMSTVTIIEDGLMIGMSALVLINR